MELVRKIFRRSNVVRAAGVAVLGLVMTLLAWLGSIGVLGGRGGVRQLEAWQDRMAFGVLVMCCALLFVAVGLLLGLPEVEREPEREAPPVDHWS